MGRVDAPALVANERAKLTATDLNDMAVAVVVVGGLTPFVAALYAGAFPSRLQVAGSVVRIVASVVLHVGARRVLRSLIP